VIPGRQFSKYLGRQAVISAKYQGHHKDKSRSRQSLLAAAASLLPRRSRETAITTEGAVTTPHERIRRRTAGTIDLDLHRQQALSERAATARPRKRHPVNTLIAVATSLALAGAVIVVFVAMAGMIHIVKFALSGTV
jgi:hypothetical protein